MPARRGRPSISTCRRPRDTSPVGPTSILAGSESGVARTADFSPRSPWREIPTCFRRESTCTGSRLDRGCRSQGSRDPLREAGRSHSGTRGRLEVVADRGHRDLAIAGPLDPRRRRSQRQDRPDGRPRAAAPGAERSVRGAPPPRRNPRLPALRDVAESGGSRHELLRARIPNQVVRVGGRGSGLHAAPLPTSGFPIPLTSRYLMPILFLRSLEVRF
jgi:hypothetical protein